LPGIATRRNRATLGLCHYAEDTEMTVHEKLYTADDLWEMSHQVGDQKRLELIKGVIIEMSPTGDVHGIVAA
jgi:hypothetical protein